MPRKSMKKMVKELMAKKKLTAKEKKLLAKMKKGGGFFDFTWLFGSQTTATSDPTALNKQLDNVKDQVCKLCKGAYGEDGCKCGNSATPLVDEPSTSTNVAATPITTATPIPTEQRNEDGNSIPQDSTSESQPPDNGDNQTEKSGGGKRKSNKKKNKRSKRASKKMKW